MKQQRRYNQNGANLAEMSLILPVALAVIYALIYFTFTLVIEGVAESAVHQAVNKATILPDLEQIPATIPTDCDSYTSECSSPESDDDTTIKFCCAVTKVVQHAKDSAMSSFIGADYESSTFAYFNTAPGESKQIRITFPTENEDATASASENSVAAYQDVPITMEMDFAIRPIFPGLPPIQRTVRAVAFYEVQSSLSYPIPVDCMGNAYGSSDYDLASCRCLKKEGGPQGINSNDQCVVCDNGATPYIEGHPIYGVKPENSSGKKVNGCWCPESSWCTDQYGIGAKANNSGSNCECVCVGWYGAYGSYEGASGSGGGTLQNCKCRTAGHTITGNSESITFETEREVSGDTCKCVKEGGGRLSDEDCEMLFPSAAGNIVADRDGCSCRCKYGGAGYNKGTAGNSCKANVWGTDWAPQYNYEQLRAGATCDCACRTSYSGTSVVEEQEYNEDTGKCECTRINGTADEVCENSGSGVSATYVQYDKNCNCVCDKKPEDYCGEGAFINGDCQCQCLSEVDQYTGFDSCKDAGGDTD